MSKYSTHASSLHDPCVQSPPLTASAPTVQIKHPTLFLQNILTSFICINLSSSRSCNPVSLYCCFLDHSNFAALISIPSHHISLEGPTGRIILFSLTVVLNVEFFAFFVAVLVDSQSGSLSLRLVAHFPSWSCGLLQFQ